MGEFIKTYENHPSIKLIKDNVLSDFTIEPATVVEINKIIKHLDPNKAIGPDKIPAKIVKLAASNINSHFTNTVNNELSRNSFSNSAKVYSVRQIFKKGDRTNKKIIDQLAF